MIYKKKFIHATVVHHDGLAGLLILNKKVWAIKYFPYFCIGNGMAYTFGKKYWCWYGQYFYRQFLFNTFLAILLSVHTSRWCCFCEQQINGETGYLIRRISDTVSYCALSDYINFVWLEWFSRNTFSFVIVWVQDFTWHYTISLNHVSVCKVLLYVLVKV